MDFVLPEQPSHGSKPDILASLNPRQREAAEAGSGPVLIIAGAGTGKTKTLTTRIARLILNGVPPGRILAVTFTNKAAAEMRQRIEALLPGQGNRVWMHTFHSFGSRLLRQHASAVGLKNDFLIYDDDDQKKTISKILEGLNRSDEKGKAAMYVNLISRAKDDLLDWESYHIHAQASQNPLRLDAAEIYRLYQAELNRAGALDFGDLLLKTATLLRTNDALREYYQEYFLHVLVDEYQDTNRTQYIMTKTLSAKHRNLCVVGDPDQSIYSWRGADIRNILDFETDFPDARVIALEQNYRSTANILSAADNVIRNNKQRKPKTLYTARSHGDPVSVLELPSDIDEAKGVAREVGRLVDEGHSLREIAVFYRTNAQSRLFEGAFAGYRIPYRIFGSIRFFDRKEVRDALAFARVLVNPADTVSLARILNVPARGISKATQDKLEAYAREKGLSLHEALLSQAFVDGLTAAARKSVDAFCRMFDELRREAPATEPALMMEKVLIVSGYWKMLEEELEKNPHDGEVKDRVGNLRELLNSVKEYQEHAARNNAEPSLSGYLQEVALTTSADAASEDTPAVTLMTVHLAKGLEFPVVFLTGLEDGLFPVGGGNAPEEELEEERRLCYVGMTRAKDKLYLTHAATRRVYGKLEANLPSRFLFESKLMSAANYYTGFKPYGGKQEERGDEHVDFVAPDTPKIIPATRSLSGRKVRHAVYGTGKVVSQTGSGEQTKITIVFDQGARQTFMLSAAPIELL